MVKFVSYDGKFPNLCSGTLVLNIDGSDVVFPEYCMCSGGSVGFDEEWNEQVESGEWTVEIPKEYMEYKDEIEFVVNENVTWGCCGGCV